MIREIYQSFKAGQLFGKNKALQNADRKFKRDEARALEREVLVSLKRLKDKLNEIN